MVRYERSKVSWKKNIERLDQLSEWVIVDLYHELMEKIEALETRLEQLE